MQLDDARCALHLGAPACFTCARCGDFGCAECRVNKPGGSFCAACSASTFELLPWEQARGVALIGAYVWTVWLCLSEPKRTFGARSTESDRRAWAFGCIGAAILALPMTLKLLLSPTASKLWRVLPSGERELIVNSYVPGLWLNAAVQPFIGLFIHVLVLATLLNRFAGRTRFREMMRLSIYTTSSFALLLTRQLLVPHLLALLAVSVYLSVYGAAIARSRLQVHGAWGVLMALFGGFSGWLGSVLITGYAQQYLGPPRYW